MFTVYFADKTVVFNNEPCVDNTDGVVCWTENGLGVTKMLEKLENNKTLHVIGDPPHAKFEEFASRFRLVGAAGGVVANENKDILMIFRNGRWDLPKGHIEKGETPEDCSVREVVEETGVAQVDRGELITITYHCYKLDGQWVMKKTWWYAMESSAVEIKPQTEEGITKVEWVPVEKLREYTAGSFPSIRKVFQDAGME